jgi:hypothetical protein
MRKSNLKAMSAITQQLHNLTKAKCRSEEEEKKEGECVSQTIAPGTRKMGKVEEQW